jgi:hypothetical protein
MNVSMRNTRGKAHLFLCCGDDYDESRKGWIAKYLTMFEIKHIQKVKYFIIFT